MEKKLVAQGPKSRQSYTVTLPIEWVKDQNLHKRKKVFLDIIANKIILSTQTQRHEIAIFNADLHTQSLIKVLQGLYRLGIKEIKIKYTNSKGLENIISICRDLLLGYELIDQGKNFVVIKEIVKESEEDMHAILRRAWLIVLQITEPLDEIEIKAYDQNLKRLLNYYQRTLILRGHLEYTKTPIYYLIADQLEKIGDEIKYIQLLNKKDARLKRYIDEFKIIIRKSYELFYSFDEHKYALTQAKSNELKNELKITGDLSSQTLHLYNISRYVNSILGNIFAVKFECLKEA